MTPYARAQWLLLLYAYLIGQSPNHFVNHYSLIRINGLLWLAYWDMEGQQEQEDAEAEADFHRWLLTLWPAPQTA